MSQCDTSLSQSAVLPSCLEFYSTSFSGTAPYLPSIDRPVWSIWYTKLNRKGTNAKAFTFKETAQEEKQKRKEERELKKKQKEDEMQRKKEEKAQKVATREAKQCEKLAMQASKQQHKQAQSSKRKEASFITSRPKKSRAPENADDEIDSNRCCTCFGLYFVTDREWLKCFCGI